MSLVSVNTFSVSEKVAEMNTKTREQKRAGGRIENWVLSDWYGNDAVFVIVGDVFEDDNWPSGIDLRTSAIVKLDLENNEAETLNTIYKLGAKSQWWLDNLDEQDEVNNEY